MSDRRFVKILKWHEWWLISHKPNGELILESDKGKLSEQEFEKHYPGQIDAYKAAYGLEGRNVIQPGPAPDSTRLEPGPG